MQPLRLPSQQKDTELGCRKLTSVISYHPYYWARSRMSLKSSKLHQGKKRFYVPGCSGSPPPLARLFVRLLRPKTSNSDDDAGKSIEVTHQLTQSKFWTDGNRLVNISIFQQVAHASQASVNSRVTTSECSLQSSRKSLWESSVHSLIFGSSLIWPGVYTNVSKNVHPHYTYLHEKSKPNIGSTLSSINK